MRKSNNKHNRYLVILYLGSYNTIIKKYINSFFQNLAKNIPNLYDNIDLFDSLFDTNIEILNIDYKIFYINSFYYNLNEFNKIKTCVSSLLNSSESLMLVLTSLLKLDIRNCSSLISKDIILLLFFNLLVDAHL